MTQAHQKVVVAGDVTLDFIQVDCPRNEEDDLNWRKNPGFVWHCLPGGALLTAEFLREAVDGPVSTYAIEALTDSAPDTLLRSLARIGPEKSKDGVLRVQEFLGYSGNVQNISRPALVDDPPDAAVVVLDDTGNGFREEQDAWPETIKHAGSHPRVILKMSHPIVQGKLWDHLLQHHAGRLTVIVSANDLRVLGANISRRLSWERTVSDLAWQLAYNPKLKPLEQAATLIIRVGIDGALVLQQKAASTATLLYDPTGYEDAYKNRFSGEMQGLTPAFTAAFTRRLVRDGETGIIAGVSEGILASRCLYRLGYGKDPEQPFYPLADLFPPLRSEAPDKETPPEKSPDGPIESIELRHLSDLEGDPHWTILHLIQRSRLESIAFRIVEEGLTALQKSVPVAQFNNLVVVDRDEIESFQSIRNLLKEYIENPSINRPFSFVVFGPPGSGKSFGIKELSKGLASDAIVSMTFNLSQFESQRDLPGIFHLIRDAALEGKLPLVFFDEFDSCLGDQSFGWLRFFLAPMQDGEFLDHGTMHPIGRAIFVFAGGTSATFNEFTKKARPQDACQSDDIKATDFISRLRGRIDIRGCNPCPNDDGRFVIRRALLLRSILERTAGHLVTSTGKVEIDRGVLRAFLKVPSYNHGVRSMQAIVEMSMLRDQKIYAQASIPPNEQLALHVDAELFRLLMLQDVLFEEAVEPLARAIHAEYLAHVSASGSRPPSAVPWENLREDFRESNRDQARMICPKLLAINCCIVPKAMGSGKAITTFSSDQVEMLAQMEHERWVREKEKDKWTKGPRSDDQKTHPDLVQWDELTEKAKEKDRNAVRVIPKLLDAAGFAVYPVY